MAGKSVAGNSMPEETVSENAETQTAEEAWNPRREAETDAGSSAPRAEGHAEETGAPATEDGGPSLEDLVPGIDAVLDAPERAPADALSMAAERIAELESEMAELKDRLLRALAELENTRRRAERDRKDAEAYGGTRLARDLLAVHDNLARALDAADEDLREKHGAFLEGVELTQRELLNAFAKHKIEKVEPERGDRFDPNLHHAMFEAPVPGAPDRSVIEVMEAGFTIAGRLLRPAMVGIAKGGAAAGTADASAGAGGEASASGATSPESSGS